MGGVATKIAQKILVIYQHHTLHAGTCKQESTHHTGGPAADDGTGGLDFFGCRRAHRHTSSTGARFVSAKGR